MAATFELDSFMLKFKSLCYNGIDSSLNVSSKNGRLTLNFNVDLGVAAESSQCHQPYQVAPKRKPRNRSYYRRQERRKLQRKSAEKVDTSIMTHEASTQRCEEIPESLDFSTDTLSRSSITEELCEVDDQAYNELEGQALYSPVIPPPDPHHHPCHKHMTSDIVTFYAETFRPKSNVFKRTDLPPPAATHSSVHHSTDLPEVFLITCSVCKKVLETREDYVWHTENKYGKEDCLILRSMLC